MPNDCNTQFNQCFKTHLHNLGSLDLGSLDSNFASHPQGLYIFDKEINSKQRYIRIANDSHFVNWKTQIIAKIICQESNFPGLDKVQANKLINQYCFGFAKIIASDGFIYIRKIQHQSKDQQLTAQLEKVSLNSVEEVLKY